MAVSLSEIPAVVGSTKIPAKVRTCRTAAIAVKIASSVTLGTISNIDKPLYTVDTQKVQKDVSHTGFLNRTFQLIFINNYPSLISAPEPSNV